MELEKTRTGIELKLFELTSSIVSENGYELYDVEYISGSSTLRVYIMDNDTKTAVIEDCIKVDRAFSPSCETEQWIPNDFVLEVSSPGVYRSLKTREHFVNVLGQIILCSVTGDVSKEMPKEFKKSKKLRGKLIKIEDDGIILDLQDFELKLDFTQIKKANLDPDLNG